jgi:hypothetical protein
VVGCCRVALLNHQCITFEWTGACARNKSGPSPWQRQRLRHHASCWILVCTTEFTLDLAPIVSPSDLSIHGQCMLTMHLFPHFLLLLPGLVPFLLSFVYAQDLSVPSAWRVSQSTCYEMLRVGCLSRKWQNPISNHSRDERINLAQAAVDELKKQGPLAANGAFSK